MAIIRGQQNFCYPAAAFEEARENQFLLTRGRIRGQQSVCEPDEAFEEARENQFLLTRGRIRGQQSVCERDAAFEMARENQFLLTLGRCYASSPINCDRSWVSRGCAISLLKCLRFLCPKNRDRHLCAA